MPLNDLTNRQDIEQLVDRFYTDVLADPIIGFIFTDVANLDIDKHKGVIVDFWCSILFKTRDYKGDALLVHENLNKRIPLKQGHFTRWLYLFSKHVDQGFAGENASLLKQRAELIAKAMVARINQTDKRSLKLVLSD